MMNREEHADHVMARQRQRRLDLTWLLEGRVHLHGFDCAAIRALKTLKGVFGSMLGSPRIEFWQTNNTNPEKVKCIDCWREHPEVAKTFVSHVVIDLRRVVDSSRTEGT